MTFKLSSVHSSSPSFTACLWHYNVSPLARLNGLGCIFGFLALSFCAYGSCCIPPVRLIRWYSSLSFFFPLCTTGRIVHRFHLYSCPLSFAFGTCSPESPVFPCHDLTSLKRRGRKPFSLHVWIPSRCLMVRLEKSTHVFFLFIILQLLFVVYGTQIQFLFICFGILDLKNSRGGRIYTPL